MSMTGTWRTTTDINNLDINYMRTVIANVRNRISANATIRAQDAVDVAWLYNNWIQHTHGYYDHHFDKWGNKNPVVVNNYDETRYDGSNYVEVNDNQSYPKWIWGGGNYNDYYYGGYQWPNAPPGFSAGALMSSTYDYYYRTTISKYQIRRQWQTRDEYTGGSQGNWRTSSAIYGLTWFTRSFNSGDQLASWVITELGNLVNSIRNHYHWFDDYWIDMAP